MRPAIEDLSGNFPSQGISDKNNSTSHALDPESLSKLASPNNKDIMTLLQSMNQSLKGDMLNITAKVGQMSQLAQVEKDLQSHESKWNAKMDGMSERVSQLEKNNKSLETRWEQHRVDQNKNLSIIQTGIDSNSSAVLELKTQCQQLSKSGIA